MKKKRKNRKLSKLKSIEVKLPLFNKHRLVLKPVLNMDIDNPYELPISDFPIYFDVNNYKYTSWLRTKSYWLPIHTHIAYYA